MKKVRVLVVEDSSTVRGHLCEILAADEEIEIVAEAHDGKQAIELCQARRPDVITMDMMLPIMSGLAATARAGVDALCRDYGAVSFGVAVGPGGELAARGRDMTAACDIAAPVSKSCQV